MALFQCAIFSLEFWQNDLHDSVFLTVLGYHCVSCAQAGVLGSGFGVESAAARAAARLEEGLPRGGKRRPPIGDGGGRASFLRWCPVGSRHDRCGCSIATGLPDEGQSTETELFRRKRARSGPAQNLSSRATEPSCRSLLAKLEV